ncbi:MAG: hypothetical protein FWD69_18230, partial [Polyangiaceae bacterium]|nr:hypothetical protein [Polyangiaceae bacterium]
YNYWGGADMVATDYSIFISPPGRFPSGNSATGHADLGGNVFDATYPTSGDGSSPVLWSHSGSPLCSLALLPEVFQQQC